MGALTEFSIPTLFNGVSRQPDHVRYSGQVDDAQNVSFSVESGGFSPRMGLRLIKKIPNMATGQRRVLHVINRDVNEQYAVVFSNGSLRVFDPAGNEKTVSISSEGISWLTADPRNFSLLTAIDYTFITKKTVAVQMDGTNVAPQPPSDAVFYVAANSPTEVAAYYIIINGTSVNFIASVEFDTSEIAAQLTTKLTTALGAGWTVGRSGSYIFVRRNDRAAFTVSQQSPNGDTAIKTYKDVVSQVADAPTRALNGMMLNVRGTSGDGYWIKFEANNGNSGEGVWRETVEPGNRMRFVASTMPWALVREANGTFTLKTLSWNEKRAGGEDEVPPPDFVGQTVSDLVFTRNRLGLVSGETVYFSEAGDYFSFWPRTSTELIDSDPFGMTNSTDSVSSFLYAVPFRRSIFVMADRAQFEIGGDTLTPGQAVLDLATTYAASTVCRPVAVGDELYFPADSDGETSILSYVYNEATVSETANDITKHCRGFVPPRVVDLIGDSIGGQLLCLSETNRSQLYAHRFFYQGNERVQSAWTRYSFSGVKILSLKRHGNTAMMLIEFGGAVWLASLFLNDQTLDNYDWHPRLDCHQFITGTYNSSTNRTTWELGYAATNPIAVTSNLFPSGWRMLSIPLTVSGTQVYATGDWSQAPMMIGQPFTSYVDFSKQYLRDEKGTAITNGRLQLRHMTLRYVDSGPFYVDVKPYGRDVKRWRRNGRVLGSFQNQIQKLAVDTGKFKFWVNSNGETTDIRVWSDSFIPYTITSAAWVGFFNEVSRQG